MCNIIGFDLGFSRSNVEAILQEWEGRLTWNEKDVSLDPLWNLELWPRPWIFKGKFQKSCICGAGWLIDMERKGCESIGSQTHFATLNFDLIRDLDLGFLRWNFRKAVSRVGASTRNLSTSTSRCMSTSMSTVKMCEYEYEYFSLSTFKVKFSNSHISGRVSWLGSKGIWDIWCWTHHATLDLQYGLSCGQPTRYQICSPSNGCYKTVTVSKLRVH